jgi:recombination protein RecA
VDLEIVRKSGAWFTYEGEQLGQGRENARQFFAEHTDIAQEVERRIREAVGLVAFSEEDDAPVEVPEAAQPASARKEKEPAGVKA